ncbi:hypothetical protein HYDPIDRAFT_165595 [Hydnomerulius pinastri MD-312]|nr:hypothetical protein HYDPIDRAFT_165595 [Hydnomerulius pinastri MD-312]
MLTYRNVEVWIEDADGRKLPHREPIKIDLIDDSISANIKLSRNTTYSVHCRSPLSLFCDIYIVRLHGARLRGARFYVDKNGPGSSENNAEGRFQGSGLRTAGGKYKGGSLGSVEVEIRRVKDIIKVEHQPDPEQEGNDGEKMDLVMIDDFNEKPWLVVRFDFWHGGSTPASTTGQTGQDREGKKSRRRGLAAGSGPSSEPHERVAQPRYEFRGQKRAREDDSQDAAEEEPVEAGDSEADRLRQEFEREEAEGKRLLCKLQRWQERLRAKRMKNLQMRRMLGEVE